MNSYIGQLVVLRVKWTLKSGRLGVVVDHEDIDSDRLMVMWTTEKGIELSIHLQDALLPINDDTLEKVRKRICDFK